MRGLRAVAVVLALAGLFVAAEVRSLLSNDRLARATAEDPNGHAPSRVETAPRLASREAATDASTREFASRLRFSWSAGSDGLGRVVRSEGNAEGPAALAVSSNGDVLVVDGTNGRLVLVSSAGERRSAPSPLHAPADVVALPTGGFALLDRLVDRSVALVDANGTTFARVPLPDRAGDPGVITGVFASDRGVCVEREHGACVPITTAEGGPPSDEHELPGRPASDGASVLHAGIVAPPSARVHLTRSSGPPLRHVFSRELTMPWPVRSLEFLDANLAGELLLALVPEPRPDAIVVMCLNAASGEEFARVEVPASPLPDETTRSFAALPDGGFLYLHRTVDGAELRRYRCGP